MSKKKKNGPSGTPRDAGPAEERFVWDGGALTDDGEIPWFPPEEDALPDPFADGEAADDDGAFAAESEYPEEAEYAEEPEAPEDGAPAPRQTPENGPAYPDLKPDYSHLKPAPGSYPYVPYESRFDKLFGRDRFYGVTSVITGVYALFWCALYFIMLMQRSVMFTQAQVTMASRGETVYSVTFSSPLLTLLRVMLYVLPAVLLIWVIALKRAEKKRAGLGSRKMTAAILGLLFLMGAVSLFDLGAAGLVFDILKQ